MQWWKDVFTLIVSIADFMTVWCTGFFPASQGAMPNVEVCRIAGNRKRRRKEPKKMKFKTGDRVKIINLLGHDMINGLKVGDIGLVTGEGDYSYFVKFGKHKRYMFEDQLEKAEDKEMKRSDLKDGMVCEVRCGDRYLWLNGDLRGTDKRCVGMQEDLTNAFNTKFDITKIYEIRDKCTLEDILKNPGELIWERKDPKEMTVAEIEEALGYPVKAVK